MAGIFSSLFAAISKKANTNEYQQHKRNDAGVRRNVGETRTRERGRMRTIRRENSADERILREVAKEDFLLNQIDEFREKAQQLQDLLLTKESKAEELSELVSQREHKANDLQNILNERQKKADEITLEVERQIDALIKKVSDKMDEIEGSLSKNVADGQKANEEQALKVYESLGQIQNSLLDMKNEVNEKIHSENVKCYRNIQDLFKGIEDKLDGINMINDKVKGVKGITVFTMIICLFNFFGLIAFALYSLGIFDMFLN